jgi:hypothetical protein
MRASLAITIGIGIGAIALTAGATRAAADVTAECEFLEMSARAGDKPAIDAELKPVEKKLKKPPFSAWNQFKLLSLSKKSLSKKKAEAISLKLGAASATLIEIVDNSKLRLTVTMDDDKRKQVVNNTSTVEAGDYLMYVHSMNNNEGHLLSVTCR